MTYQINPAALHNGIEYARRLQAERHAAAAQRAGVGGASTSGANPAAPFVLPQGRPSRQIQHWPQAPARFAEQAHAIHRQPIARADRLRTITGQVNGRAFAYELAYEDARPHRAHDPLPRTQQAALSLFKLWPQQAAGAVQALGSRSDHRGAEKKYAFQRMGDGLRISALHRTHSDLELLADGRIYLDGQQVTEASTPKVRQRVASRMNAAAVFLEACRRTLAEPPPTKEQAVQVALPAGGANASTQVAEMDLPRPR